MTSYAPYCPSQYSCPSPGYSCGTPMMQYTCDEHDDYSYGPYGRWIVTRATSDGCLSWCQQANVYFRVSPQKLSTICCRWLPAHDNAYGNRVNEECRIFGTFPDGGEWGEIWPGYLPSDDPTSWWAPVKSQTAEMVVVCEQHMHSESDRRL